MPNMGDLILLGEGEKRVIRNGIFTITKISHNKKRTKKRMQMNFFTKENRFRLRKETYGYQKRNVEGQGVISSFRSIYTH